MTIIRYFYVAFSIHNHTHTHTGVENKAQVYLLMYNKPTHYTHKERKAQQ